MPHTTTDAEPSPTLQARRINDITRDTNAVDDVLDDIAEQLRDFHADDADLPEHQQMPHLDAMDLSRALDETVRGIRAMRRILDHHHTTLTAPTQPAGECSKRAHLRPIRDKA